MKTATKLMMGINLGAITISAGVAIAAESKSANSASVDRGRYIAKIAGCNDCHTPGYAVSGGKVPEKEWLIGDALGFSGDWGTTYPPNLRIYLSSVTEAQWVKFAKSVELRPPMPWFALRDMTEQDLRAFYRFVKTLGPVGQPAPAYLPPGQVPKGPYVQFPAAPK